MRSNIIEKQLVSELRPASVKRGGILLNVLEWKKKKLKTLKSEDKDENFFCSFSLQF